MSPQSAYVGEELEIFAAAANWKRYWSSHARRFMAGDVAEVGAGIGANTEFLCRAGGARRWVCLEPDPLLADQLRSRLKNTSPNVHCDVISGTLEDLADADRFDSIVYIDVLEHISDDKAELLRAANRLRPGGTLIVLAPAHQWLFSAFDTAIGHYRRYSKKTLASVVPTGLRREALKYLDSVGLIPSAANRLLLRSSTPTASQIRVWDRLFVPCSRIVDPLLHHSVGKTVFGVWRMPL